MNRQLDPTKQNQALASERNSIAPHLKHSFEKEREREPRSTYAMGDGDESPNSEVFLPKTLARIMIYTSTVNQFYASS